MRSFKKAIAVVLTLAMLVAMFAFQASAAGTYSMVLQGAETASVGDEYTVKVRLNDPNNEVGGVAGTIVATGAVLKEVEVNPQLLDYNKTGAAGYTDEDAVATIINKVSDAELSFASVANLEGNNPATRVWFILTYEITGDATFTLTADYSNKNGSALLSSGDSTVLAPAAPTSSLELVPAASVATTDDVTKQGLKLNVAIENGIPEDALEYGMLFCPTQLLGGTALTMDNNNANIKIASAEMSGSVDEYNAYIKFNFSEANKDYAYTLTGVKFTARAYYKTAEGEYVYSENNATDVVGGVFDKAIISVAADLVAKTANADQVADALADLSDKDNKQAIFTYLTQNPIVE